jgi:hypothetical protein
MIDFQKARNRRHEHVTNAGKFRSGRMFPVAAVPVRPSEGGMLSQVVTFELDPLAGRLLTPVYGELLSIFVPMESIDAIVYPTAQYSGMTEVIRQKLLSGAPLWTLAVENDITKACGIVPVSVGGVKQTLQCISFAYNAAVNFARKRKYVNASMLHYLNTAVVPALLGETVLQRLNGVLDPDDRINGAVQLDIPNMRLPVTGFSRNPSPEATGVIDTYQVTSPTQYQLGGGAQYLRFENELAATFSGATAGNVSLVDFYNAQKADELVRQMRKMLDENPETGEDAILRWAHGLKVDVGKIPFVLAERSAMFGRSVVGATDSAGVSADVLRTDMAMRLQFQVPVPRTELGGLIITIATVKPDEVLRDMPHPVFSKPWGMDNFVADELALDPVPVTYRQLDCNVAAGSENTVAFYTGLNELNRFYVNYGFNRLINPSDVASKTSIWTYPVPLSVSPDSILYPAVLAQYPFADQNADICTYTITSSFVCETPMQFGPSPVETLAVISSAHLLGA